MSVFDVSMRVRQGWMEGNISRDLGWHTESVKGIRAATREGAIEQARAKLLAAGYSISLENIIVSNREEVTPNGPEGS